MEEMYKMSNSEKELLHIIGKNPDMSGKELLEHTKYRWERTVKRKVAQLKEQHILEGPIYDLNYSKLCRNPLHKVVCILETNLNYEDVIPYLRIIEPLRWVYPVMSPHKRLLNVGYFSSNDGKLRDILQLLKDNSIISDYIMRVWRTKRLIVTPNLFGDFNPSLDGLLDPCDVPDMTLPYHDTVWKACDIAILPYIERGTRLVEILREERKQLKNWTYEQIKYSREKMIRNGLIEKKYVVNPLKPEQCAHFHLFLKTEDLDLTLRMLCNFAKGERVFKLYTLCDDWGFISCSSHPLFLKDLMGNLDEIEEITQKEIFPKRSFPPRRYCIDHMPEYTYFDFETQTMEYPYHVYREEIKEKIEREQVVISV